MADLIWPGVVHELHSFTGPTLFENYPDTDHRCGNLAANLAVNPVVNLPVNELVKPRAYFKEFSLRGQTQ